MASASATQHLNNSLQQCCPQQSRRPSRQLCVRPCAIASPPDAVRADDTAAEARRRLARQFRKHKLEPHTAASGVAPLGGKSSSSSSYSSQLVRPNRSRMLQQQQDLTQQQQQQHQQLWPHTTSAAYIRGQLHPADAAAAAAAREMLEWQFQLEPEAGPGSSLLGSATTASPPGSAADDPLLSNGSSSLSLPSSLLPGISASPAGQGADAGKDLTKAIMRASHWRQVQVLIQEHAPEAVNTQHLCAALTRMVYLQPTFHSSSSGSGSGGNAMPAHGQQQQQQQQQQQVSVSPAGQFLQQLYSSIVDRVQELQYRQSCNVLWAAGKLKHTALPDADSLAALYQHARQSCAAEQRHLEQQVQQLGSEEGGAAGASASAAQAQAREQQLQWRAHAFSHAGQIAASLVSLQQAMPAQQLQDTVAWVMSNTRDLLQDHIQQHQPVPEPRSRTSAVAAKLLLQQQRRCQRPLPARDVANLAASLAALGAQPSPAWLSAFAAALGCKGLVYLRSYRDLSQLLWATATFSKSAAEGSAAANSLQAAAAALLFTAQALPLSSCDGQALANTLWSLATLGQRPPLPWLNRVLQHAEAAAARGFLSAQGLSMTFWALAALAVVPQSSCLAALLSATQQHLRHLTAQGFSNILWALAVLERPPSKDWLAGFWPACRTLLPQMTSQGLVNCLWAAARLGLQPPQEWVGDVAALLLNRGVSSLTRQGLSNTIWALSKISITCRHAHQLLQSCLLHAATGLQQQWRQQLAAEQEQEQVVAAGQEGSPAAAAGGDAEETTTVDSVSNSSSSSVDGFNIYELSGLLHAVCQLRMREPAACDLASASANSSMDGGGPSSDASSASASNACSADLLTELTGLIQEVSTPLLPTASPTELSIMLWSQVAMPVSAGNSPAAVAAAAAPAAAMPAQHVLQQGMPAAAGPTQQHNSILVIPRKWLSAWFAATRSSFSGASSRDLACWMWCLAKKGLSFKPHEQWLASWQVASYRQMGAASSQDLSNMLWGLASLGISPDPAWLQQYMQEVNRRQLQKLVEPQHYGNIGWALAKMGHRPERFWALRFQEEVYSLLPRFKPQELSNVLWAMAALNMKVHEGLLVEVKAHMTAHLSAYKVNEVAVSLWALSRLKGQPGGRLMAAALQHCFSQARQLTPRSLSMLMWSVGNLEQPPPKSWVAKLLVATQVRMQGFSAQELSMLAVSLARLEYRPADVWLDAFAAAAAARMESFEAQALANTLWAVATLHYTPSEAWMNVFDAQLTKHVSHFTPAHVAMTLWALSQLQWLPAQPLLQQLQQRAEMHQASYILSSQRMLARAVRVLQKVESEEEEDDVE